ncbi:hypothetical protein [Bradyrhizobium sp. HKCCYLS20291]|uniref:hypothetical protein n=1 Tax=Bradyrhizobium sp. HKCCYLS20291 TaxID=3420766 RepID=UPI003EBC7079
MFYNCRSALSLVVTHLCLVAAALLTLAGSCSAAAQNTLFGKVFNCPGKGKSSVCVWGTVAKATTVTLLAKGWKSSGTPQRVFPNTEFENNYKTFTQIELPAASPKDAFMIAVFAPSELVSDIPLQDTKDDAVIRRIGAYVKKAKLNLAPDIQMLGTRLYRMSPTILLSQTFLANADYAATVKGRPPRDCEYCDVVPALVGEPPIDLFASIRSKEVNSVEHVCGGIEFAFALSERPHVVSYASICESDSFSTTLIHDLSGKTPKLVFD